VGWAQPSNLMDPMGMEAEGSVKDKIVKLLASVRMLMRSTSTSFLLFSLDTISHW